MTNFDAPASAASDPIDKGHQYELAALRALHAHGYATAGILPSAESARQRTAISRSLAIAAIPRTRDDASRDYYEATDRKHFGDRTEPGSKFLDPELRTVEDVVALAVMQRGHLRGDDAQMFILRGADPDAFRDGNRYLFVHTPGTVGVIHSTALADAALLSVVRTKPGAPCSLVAVVDAQPDADYAVVIITTDGATGEDLVITAFPGTVTKPVENEWIESLEGGALTVAAARDLLGEEFWVNTKLPVPGKPLEPAHL